MQIKITAGVESFVIDTDFLPRSHRDVFEEHAAGIINYTRKMTEDCCDAGYKMEITTKIGGRP